MSLRETLLQCGVESSRADALLAGLQDCDEAIAQAALRDLCRALTPVLLKSLREILADERRKRGAE